MNAGELIVLGRTLTRIGTAAMRDSTLPDGSVPMGITMVGADILGHSPTSVGEIADRTGLRRPYVSKAVIKLCDQGIAETAADPHDERRTLVRFTASPQRLTAAAAEPVDQALRDALGTDRETATTILSALAELAERLSPGRSGKAPATRAEPARPEPARAEATRVEPAQADPARAGHTRVDHDQADRTRVEFIPADRGRADRTQAERTRVEPRPASLKQEPGHGRGGPGR